MSDFDELPVYSLSYGEFTEQIITPGLSNRRIIETRIAMKNRKNLIG